MLHKWISNLSNRHINHFHNSNNNLKCLCFSSNSKCLCISSNNKCLCISSNSKCLRFRSKCLCSNNSCHNNRWKWTLTNKILTKCSIRKKRQKRNLRRRIIAGWIKETDSRGVIEGDRISIGKGRSNRFSPKNEKSKKLKSAKKQNLSNKDSTSNKFKNR